MTGPQRSGIDRGNVTAFPQPGMEGTLMSGKHESETSGSTIEVDEEPMPDPDNLRVDVTALPLTGPITIPRRD